MKPNPNRPPATLAIMLAAVAALLLTGVAGAHEEHDEGSADVTILMGEMYFEVEGMEPGEPFPLEAGEPHTIRVVNEGQVEHEVHFGTDPSSEQATYENNLFGLSGEHAAHGFLGLALEPGESALLHVWIPEERAGEWEIGCFLPGHYEAGMHAPFVVESPSH